MKSELISPVTGSTNVTVVDLLKTADIVELYRIQQDIDVSSNFGELEFVELVECRDTGYRFFAPREVEGDAKFYRDLQSRINESGLEYDRTAPPDQIFAIGQIPAGMNLLEVGCNTGKFLELVQAKCSLARGLDLNETAVQAAKAKGLDVVAERIEVHAAANDQFYDVVCAFQVLEHVYDVAGFFGAMVKCTRPGGRVIVSVPNNEPFFQRHSKFEVLNLPPHHVGLWNLSSLRRLGEFFGLEFAGHQYTQTSGLLVDSYVRARSWSGLMKPPMTDGSVEKLKIFAVAPAAVLAGVLDKLRGTENHAHITVVFEKS